MFRGVRRSNRLIESPWLHNRPKKPPVYINLEEGQEIVLVNSSTGKKTTLTESRNSRGAASKRRGVDRSSCIPAPMDIVSEWKLAGVAGNNASSDEENEFVTPVESFSRSNKVVHQENDSAVEGQGGSKRPLFRLGRNNKLQLKRNKRLREDENYVQEDSPVTNPESLKTIAPTAQPKCSAKKIVAGAKRGRRKMPVDKPSAEALKKNKIKKTRTYENYIQKKFSPSIMTDVLANLSEEQKTWVTATGFGDLLTFRMVWYTHTLGYNVVNAFNSRKSCLDLKAGTVEINDKTVRSVLGLPLGSETIEQGDNEDRLGQWGKQFDGCLGCEVSPLMLSNRILGNNEANGEFKLNFLVLLYNFFIEGHQNRFLNRDVLRYSLDIDNCGKYNWCRLLIDKLKVSHDYWKAVKTRYFPGSLPFLIYLYVSSVIIKGTIHIPPMYPAFKGWSDRFLRERQKYEASNDCFGEGVIVKLKDKTQENPTTQKMNTNSENSLAEYGQRPTASDFGNQDSLDESGSKGNDAEATDNEADIMVEDSFTIPDDCVNDGWEDWVNTSQPQNLDVQDTDLRNKIEQLPHADSCALKAKQTTGQGGEEHKINKSATEKTQNLENSSELMTMTQYMDDFLAQITKTGTYDRSRTDANNASTITKDVENNSPRKSTMNGNSTFMNNEVGNNLETPEIDVTLRMTKILERQPVADDVIETHFNEHMYVEKFAQEMAEMSNLFGICLDKYEVSCALYPDNPVLQEMTTKYKYFFKLFHETSPLSKKLFAQGAPTNETCRSTHCDDSAFVPSFSLGISQVTPKNLNRDMDEFVVAKDSDHIKSVIACNIRPRRETRISQICRSPFVSRVVDISSHVISAEEKRVWEWLFSNKRNKKEHLFEWNNRMCTKAHFQSLDYNKLVETTLIDAWTCLLNENEILRADSSPLRLFLNTETTYGPMNMLVNEDDLRDVTKRNSVFHDNMELVLEMVNGIHNRTYAVHNFDMFVFPIYNATHHYIICYNMKKPSWEIIDNRVPTSNFAEMFGDIPFLLHDLFCDWISNYNLPKGDEITSMQPKVVRLGWQTTDNWIDCGVYVMRHMETYMGSLFSWKVGLHAEDGTTRDLLKKLRLIYCHKLLTWNGNKHRSMIMRSVANYTKGKRAAI